MGLIFLLSLLVNFTLVRKGNNSAGSYDQK
jgi:hypothetical protein